jgi:hypothetical protein
VSRCRIPWTTAHRKREWESEKQKTNSISECGVRSAASTGEEEESHNSLTFPLYLPRSGGKGDNLKAPQRGYYPRYSKTRDLDVLDCRPRAERSMRNPAVHSQRGPPRTWRIADSEPVQPFLCCTKCALKLRCQEVCDKPSMMFGLGSEAPSFAGQANRKFSKQRLQNFQLFQPLTNVRGRPTSLVWCEALCDGVASDILARSRGPSGTVGGSMQRQG